ncbi:hypothetical protein B0T20DRAFT_54641 [Sordaria brevicollis]|uniref:Uncharacterized protein n=1 Tax=Sordaria brevicollis TaxID=83679 RepID=A0AAE0P311_SORBR|nr:hypothetical protein B0T20DRAFT_54641 [Sordaria brevicollis]
MQLTSVLATVAALQVVAALPSASSEVAKVVTGASVSADEIPDAMKFNPANATDVASRGLDKRASLGVYLCRDAPFVAGTCQHIYSNHDECIALDSYLAGQVSSIGPDQGAYCRFFFDSNCPSNNDENGCRHLDSQYPGRSNLNTASNNVCGVNSNDKIRSYRCWAS